MNEASHHFEVVDHLEQCFQGNPAASTLLAHREVLLSLGMEERVAQRVAESNDLGFHIAAIAMSGAPLRERGEIITSIGIGLNNNRHIAKSGRAIVKASLGELWSITHNLATFEGGSNRDCQEVYELQVYTRRNIPRLTREQRLKKQQELVFKPFMDEKLPELLLAINLMTKARRNSLQTS